MNFYFGSCLFFRYNNGMDEKELLKARVKELSQRANSDGYLTHTSFLTLSEQNLFFQILKEDHINPNAGIVSGVKFILFGGREDNDRNILFFLPYYMEDAEFYSEMKEGNIITCFRIEPKNVKFSDKLTHRDYLGALMHLGYEREVFGDILTDGTTGYLFLLKSVADQIKDDIAKVKHTVVEVSEIKPSECPFEQRYEEKSITIASNRIDTILGEAFHLSRRSAQELIGKESVFVNGITMMSNAHSLKANDRVSVKGEGKFIYVGNEHETKKGRIAVNIKIYA